MLDGKAVLINGVKHFGLSALAVGGAAILGWLGNDTALSDVLTKAGVPGYVALALVPLLHSVLSTLQKKFLPGVADANPTAPTK